MKIEAPSTDERAAGIYAWFTIPKSSFGKALQMMLPSELQRDVLHAVKSADDETTEVGIPISKGEAAILRYAGVAVA